MRQVALLVAGTLTFGLLTAIPACWIWGTGALACAATAAALCLAPTAATLAWGAWAFRQAPEQQLTMVLGGTGIRIAVVLLGGWALYMAVPYFREVTGYWFWILAFYLFTLTLEMILLVRGQTAGKSAAGPKGAPAGAAALSGPPQQVG